MAQYTITEEQIKELAKWKHGKRLTQKWFPEVFENKLEVGKWYKHTDNENILLNYNESKLLYGFGSVGLWTNGFRLEDFDKIKLIPATNEEVESALIAEAKKRGLYDLGRLTIKTIGNRIVNNFQTSGNDYFWSKYTNTLFLDGVTIFSNGKWASIIKEKTLSKSEAEAKLTELCKDGFEYKIEF